MSRKGSEHINILGGSKQIHVTALFTNTQTLEFKGNLYIAFFAAISHNYDHKQWTLKQRNTKKWIEIHQTQITNLDLVNSFKQSSVS